MTVMNNYTLAMLGNVVDGREETERHPDSLCDTLDYELESIDEELSNVLKFMKVEQGATPVARIPTPLFSRASTPVTEELAVSFDRIWSGVSCCESKSEIRSGLSKSEIHPSLRIEAPVFTDLDLSATSNEASSWPIFNWHSAR